MIAVLSPAKTFNEKPQQYSLNTTTPDYLNDSQKLVTKLKKQSIKSLEGLMSVNRKIAQLNKQRYENWTLPFTEENAKPAAYLFRGEVYIGLDTASMTTDEMAFAQKNLRILSGMYGLLRPMDLIQPYRLEMGTQLKINRKNNLYEFWGDQLAEQLNKEVKSHRYKVIVNLASEQYVQSVQTKALTLPLITPTFKEDRNGVLKSIHVYAKRARGLMARYIINNRIENPEDMKSFDVDRYEFSPEHSNDNEWTFVRLKA